MEAFTEKKNYRLRQSPLLKRARRYFSKYLNKAEALLTKMSSKLKNTRLVPALNKSQIKLDIDSHKFFLCRYGRDACGRGWPAPPALWTPPCREFNARDVSTILPKSTEPSMVNTQAINKHDAGLDDFSNIFGADELCRVDF